MTQVTAEALVGKSGSELVGLYNVKAKELGLPEVKRFSDMKAALKRTSAIYAGEVKPKVEKAGQPAVKKKVAKGKGVKVAAADAKERKVRGMRFVFPTEKEIKPVREGSKRHMALELLSRPEGATFEQVMKKTGWDRKDCYEGVRLLHYYSGYGMSHNLETGVIHVKGK